MYNRLHKLKFAAAVFIESSACEIVETRLILTSISISIYYTIIDKIRAIEHDFAANDRKVNMIFFGQLVQTIALAYLGVII